MGSGSQMVGIVLLIVINETKSVKIFHCVAHCQQHRATSEEGILLLARCKRENPIGQFSFLRLHFILLPPPPPPALQGNYPGHTKAAAGPCSSDKKIFQILAALACHTGAQQRGAPTPTFSSDTHNSLHLPLAVSEKIQ